MKIILWTAALGFSMSVFAAQTEEILELNPFGKVAVYRQVPRPGRVVLFASGDGGWNLGVVDMAKALASLDALVVGVDVVHYLRVLNSTNQPCGYPAGDFERLSQFVQKQFAYPEYVTPILVGYSSGAALVYAALVQAPSTTFRGAISLGFCPDLPLTKPFCRGSGLDWRHAPGGGVVFLPARTLEVPWIALQGLSDRVCRADSTESFVGRTVNAEIITLPNVGHGFTMQKNWMPQFKKAFERIAGTASTAPPKPEGKALQDLPLLEVSAKNSFSPFLAVHLTGDGGWGVTDRGLSNALAGRGIPVIGFNSLQYFWKKRTPEEAAADLGRILSHFLAAWKKEKAVLIGYSFGADVLPFMINRLPETLRSRIQTVVLLGPSRSVEFEFHVSQWLGMSGGESALPVLPEIEKLRGQRIVCVAGENDKECCCRDLDAGLAKVILIKGGHLIWRNFGPIVDAISNETR
jgi:type IV secretory pathway VirJ component